MSILIKGMEMPTRCFSCQMCDVENEEVNCEISHGYYIECRKVDPKIAIQERPSWCPLVEVPEDVQPVKHGRWIKARGSWCTPGGDPVWECSECGKGMHVYGIEHGTYGSDVADGQWVACPNCGAKMNDE